MIKPRYVIDIVDNKGYLGTTLYQAYNYDAYSEYAALRYLRGNHFYHSGALEDALKQIEIIFTNRFHALHAQFDFD